MDVTIGTVYSLEYMQELKQQIQGIIGGKISKITAQNQVRFACHRQISCKFFLKFLRKKGINEQFGYQLIEYNDQHDIQCYNNTQDRRFYQTRSQLLDNRSKIKQLILQHKSKEQQLNPKKLLEFYTQMINRPKNFLYEGILDHFMRRRIKKKFDNIVADIKRQIGIESNYTKRMKTKYRKKEKNQRKQNKKKFCSNSYQDEEINSQEQASQWKYLCRNEQKQIKNNIKINIKNKIKKQNNKIVEKYINNNEQTIDKIDKIDKKLKQKKKLIKKNQNQNKILIIKLQQQQQQ